MKFLFILLLLVITGFINAQLCLNYYYLQNNKTVEMTVTNSKGKETGRMVYSVTNSTTNENIYSATIHSEFIDTKGKSISKADNNIKCLSGVLMMDMKMFIPSAQQEQMGSSTATASNVYLEYPINMKVGDKLKDGQFSMDYESSSGLKSSIEISITNRKIEGNERVTTPAGEWDCFKISSDNKIATKVAGIGIPIKLSVTEWFSPRFGVVKTESKTGKTEISSVK